MAVSGLLWLHDIIVVLNFTKSCMKMYIALIIHTVFIQEEKDAMIKIETKPSKDDNKQTRQTTNTTHNTYSATRK